MQKKSSSDYAMKAKSTATFYAVLAAALYAINIPLSKVLLNHIEPTMMASFLYLGAGIGLFIFGQVEKFLGKGVKREHLTKKELPFTIAMVVLDIAAPILLMFGITLTNSANVSLLNNFEIVATSVIALVVFKELISKRLWIAILLVTAASIILTFDGEGSFSFNKGSLFVIGACLCWGFENNCTKMISNKSSVEIVVIKGLFSGVGSLICAFIMREHVPSLLIVLIVLLLGFVAYGLSIHFYIMAQKELGAAKTSAYYSIAPFLGVAFSFVLLQEVPSIRFYIALIIMLISTYIMTVDTIKLQHTHEHRHGDIVHTHLHTHEKDSENHSHEHKFEVD